MKILAILFFWPLVGTSQDCMGIFKRFLTSPIQKDFNTLIAQWPKTQITRPHSVIDSAQIVIAEIEGEYFFARFSSMPFSKPPFYLLKDLKGQIHFLDDAHLSKASLYFPKDSFSPKEVLGIHPLRSSRVYGDMAPLRKRVCEHYHNFKTLPEFKKIVKILNKGPPNIWRPRLFRKYLALCTLGGGSTFALGTAIHHLAIDISDSFPVANHTSNFSLGFPFMMLMDQCLKTLHPVSHHAALASTLGVNVLANIYIELDLLKNLKGKDQYHNFFGTKNDFADFTAGMLATISYAYFSLWLEKTSWISKTRLCY